jgi:hypothetical protein
MSTEIKLTTRNATLGDLAALLKDHRARRLDVVAGAEAIRAQDGHLLVDGTVQEITEEGVTSAAGLYLPTSAADSDIASKLGPTGSYFPTYLRKLREAGRLDLWDLNVNGWLHGLVDPLALDPEGKPSVIHEPDRRAFMLRLLKGDDGGTGVVRAMLSDKYFVIDNLDVLVSVLAGIRDAEAEVEVTSCDLTESKMYVRVESPKVRALAPRLLANYRNPWTGKPITNAWGGSIEEIKRLAEREGKGYEQGAEPVVFAGLLISNSELGDGAFSIKPRITIEICGNSHTVEADAIRVVHLGGRMEEGVINWSEDTQRKALELVASKTRDAVGTFLTPGYVERQIVKAEEDAGIAVTDAKRTIHEVVTKSVIPAGLEDEVLNLFIKGGQMTAGGVMQAVTAAAQGVEDADLQADMEGAALGILAHAAKLA